MKFIKMLWNYLWVELGNATPRLPYIIRIKNLCYKIAGLKFKGKATIWGPITVTPYSGIENIYVGAGTFINTETRFGVPDKDSPIIIGKEVKVGPRVMFETINHDLAHDSILARGAYTKPITIEDAVWIGAGSTILQGVTIGKGSVIAAGSIVNKDIPADSLYGGAPARFLRKIEQTEKLPQDRESMVTSLDKATA